jgi:hypothetical protein
MKIDVDYYNNVTKRFDGFTTRSSRCERVRGISASEMTVTAHNMNTVADVDQLIGILERLKLTLRQNDSMAKPADGECFGTS